MKEAHAIILHNFAKHPRLKELFATTTNFMHYLICTKKIRKIYQLAKPIQELLYNNPLNTNILRAKCEIS